MKTIKGYGSVRRKFPTCKTCNNTFNSKSGKYNQFFCNKKCFYSFQQGENHPLFKNARTKTPTGYIVITVNKKLIPEHRHIMEQHINRKLLDNEVVHHINHNRSDNRIENLKIMLRSDHSRHHGLLKERKKPTVCPFPSTIGLTWIDVNKRYRVRIVRKCFICSKFFWTRKDSDSTCCSITCGNIKRFS